MSVRVLLLGPRKYWLESLAQTAGIRGDTVAIADIQCASRKFESVAGTAEVQRLCPELHEEAAPADPKRQE